MKLLKMLFVICVACFITQVHADDVVIGEVYTGDTINGESLKLPSFSVSNQNLGKKGNLTTMAAAATPAGISYYQVYAIGSSNVGWEYPSASQNMTTFDHGGSQLRVVTLQYGYGNSNGATLNATKGVNYLRSYLCGSLSTLHYCAVSETVTGYLDYYSFDGMQSGYYSSSASSVVSPFGTFSDYISIQ